LRLAYQALRAGTSFPAVLNAANEIAVAAFLEKKIKFTDIAKLIENQLEAHHPSSSEDFDQLQAIDRSVREKSSAFIEKYKA